MKEIWRAVVGYEGLYEVSNHGRVRSPDKWITRKNSTDEFTHEIFREERLLTPKRRGEYLAVILYNKKSEKKYYSIHRLVAEAFLSGKDRCVNHKDEDKHNNHVDNLEWCSYSYNQEYSSGVETKLLSPQGEIITFKSRAKAMEIVGTNRGNLWSLMSGRRNQINGWRSL